MTGVHIGSDCGILGKVVHIAEQNSRYYLFTDKEIEIDITDWVERN
jgi:hypothetical protein